MKILVVVGGYFPAINYGGPVVSIDNLCNVLCDEITFYVLTVDHDLKSDVRLNGIEEGWNNRENARIIYLREKEIKYKNLITIVMDIKPDILYLNSFFLAKFTIPVLRIAKKTGIPLLLAPRGEFSENAFDKLYKKLPYTMLIRFLYIKDNIYFQATNEYEVKRFIKIMRVNPERIVNITNIPMMNNESNVTELPNRQKLKIVFLARIHKSKNLLYALKILEKIHFNVEFNIYGNIEDGQYWDECKQQIERMPTNITVNYKGVANRNQINQIFGSHHVFLFPTLTENFGHSIAESMLSGCPVIISDNTPWNWIKDVKCGYVLSLDDEKGFLNALNNIYSLKDTEYHVMREKCKEKAVEFLKLSEIVDKYKQTFYKMVERKTHNE